MIKTCKKCGYERRREDSALEYECPKCGAIYAKVEALTRNADFEPASHGQKSSENAREDAHDARETAHVGGDSGGIAEAVGRSLNSLSAYFAKLTPVQAVATLAGAVVIPIGAFLLIMITSEPAGCWYLNSRYSVGATIEQPDTSPDLLAGLSLPGKREPRVRRVTCQEDGTWR